MKNADSLKEFKKLNSDQITEKIDQLRKDLFDLRFKQATRQLNETHKFKIIKKQVAQLLTLSKSQSSSQITSE
jgi:large subunit ribosomal protein L29